jgi:hypothetical protein
MNRWDEVLICVGCGAEITWAPVMIGQTIYCCGDCAAGQLCACGERMEWGDERRGEGQASYLMSGVNG